MPTINVNQTNASETAKGIVEEATQAEVNAGTDTGGTGAQLFIAPSKLPAGVRVTPLTGFSVGANSTILATDSVAGAFAKTQGQINARATTSAVNLKADIASPTFTGIPAAPTASAGTNTTQIATTAFVTTAVAAKPEFFGVAMSDETTVLAAASTSVPRTTIHAPYAMTLTRVYAGLTTAGTGASNCIVDIHVNGTTIMDTTKILFSASTKLSADGTLSTTAVAAGDLIEFFLDQRDTNNVAAGLKCYIIGHQ